MFHCPMEIQSYSGTETARSASSRPSSWAK